MAIPLCRKALRIFTDHPFHHVYCVYVIIALKIYENSHTWTALVRRITTQRVTDVTQRQQPLIITKKQIFLIFFFYSNSKVLARETRADIEIQKLYVHNTKEDVHRMETLTQRRTAS